jgi:type VI protein secretion system component Hcp
VITVATDSYLVFTPQNGPVWTAAENEATGLSDPFAPTAPQNAFFPVADWALDVQQTFLFAPAPTGAGAGKVTFDPLSVTRNVDSVSPQLFQMSAAGQTFSFVDLVQVRTTAGAKTGQIFLAWRFGLVGVAGVGWASDDEVPRESVSFQFGSTRIHYLPLTPTGPGKPVSSGWDRVKNVPI